MSKYFLLVLTALFIIAPTASAAFIGVATDAYAYVENSENDAYITNYAGTNLFEAIGDYHGFIVNQENPSLTVFTNAAPWETTRKQGQNQITVPKTDIYLMSNLGGDNGIAAIGTGANALSLSTPYVFDHIDGYSNPRGTYYGVKLDASSIYWNHTANSLGLFEFTAPISFTGLLTPGDYFFACADDNGVAGLQFPGSDAPYDTFSPKTKSAGGFTEYPKTAVPEPASVLLLGMGLMGFASSKFAKKSK